MAPLAAAEKAAASFTVKALIIVSSVVAVVFVASLVANHPASTQAIAAAAPCINWMKNLSLPEVLTYLSQAQALWNGEISIKSAAEKIAAEKAAAEKAAGEKAAAEKAAAEEAAVEGRWQMVNKMRNFFSSVVINRKDADEAERIMRGDLVEKWDEKIFNKITTGIQEDKFEEYLELITKRFGIEDLKELFMEIKFCDLTEEKVWEFGLEKELKSVFGFVSFKKIGGKIDAVYAIHSLQAKMADKVVITTKTNYALWVIPYGSETSVEREPVKFGTKDIDKIRNQYFRKRALEAFKEDGLLEEIKYI